MIRLFDIQKKKKQLNQQDADLLKQYQSISQLEKEELLKQYQAKEEGLEEKEVQKRREQQGLNIVLQEEKKTWFSFLLNAFYDKFILILVVLAVINWAISDALGSFIILGIALVSGMIRFIQDYSSYRFNQKLKEQIFTTTTVLRKGKEKEIKVEEVVPGDIITLNAGSVIPADLCLIESKDLFLNQSVFTGESVPVEKTTNHKKTKEIFSIDNICLMGASVVSGTAKGVVISTGFHTYLGKMGKEIDTKKEITNFDKGMNQVTKLLIRYMVIVSVAVFIIYGFLRKDILGAVLFALSVAVGITPSMLPMIVNVNLTKGSKTLAKKKTLVKKIESIQNLGAMDVLCTDKTGTLTKGEIVLQKYIDVEGNEDISILEYAYLNSYYGTGMKNLVDRAILAYAKKQKMEKIQINYEKVDEIPFDYDRRKMSVVVKHESEYRMITKGALEEILKSCSTVKRRGKKEPLTDDMIQGIHEKAKELASTGMQVIALASKREYRGKGIFNSSDETNMTFIGFVGFLDPPKKEVKNTLLNLKKYGVTTKILTGDNPYATKNICELVGMENDNVLLGTDIEQMTEDELSKQVEKVDVFARLNPLQKERVVKALRDNGHVVGYMGDGVNDAPSLHMADVGLCVNTATDIAKEASDIMLLEKSLKVVLTGIIEGRKVYGNIMKYMKMALSSDFGDVFSILIASIFLPFLPLLPIQMLIQDFIYDFSQIAIPYDNVDPEFLEKPRKWDTRGLGRFMNVMGPVSSIIDVLAFLAFWYILGYNSVEMQSYFQTAWFVECLISEILIIHFVRTSKIPFIQSRANPILMIMTLVTIVATIVTPILLRPIQSFHFVVLPPVYYLIILLLALTYMVLVQIVKKIYMKKYGEWL